MIGFECGRTGPLNEVGGEPYQPIWMAELGSVDGLPGMLIARKVSSVVCSLPPSLQPTTGVLELVQHQ